VNLEPWSSKSLGVCSSLAGGVEQAWGPGAESMATTEAKKLPAELQISEKWDKCLERTLFNVGTGLVVGGLLSFVVAREFLMMTMMMMTKNL
jgi:hypothetical protein